tara:strand:- start:184 stop:1227 length:1044 start_codon:yes stop_codon:yes gene_type:complete
MRTNEIKKKLVLVTQDLKAQDKIYHPTIFWKKISNKFTEIFRHKGLINFRRQTLSTNFFVPLYNFFGEKNIKVIRKYSKKNSKKFKYYFENLLSGNLEALSDYKTFIAADDKEKLPQLHKYSESKIGKPIEHFYFDKKYYSRSSLNYLLGLVFLKKNIKNFVPKTFLEIGGGYGTLGEILFHSKIKKIKYINIDIPPLSLVSEYYLTKNFGKKNVESYLNNRYKNKINLYKLKKKITCLCSWQIERLVGKIDIFVNFISFQEMEPKVVKNYIYHINRLSPKFILLRNLKEGKQIKSTKIHGVLKQIKKNDYIKFLKTNYVLVNSNVRPYGFKTYDNFNSELLLFKKK